jgi:hypothetical protein
LKRPVNHDHLQAGLDAVEHDFRAACGHVEIAHFLVRGQLREEVFGAGGQIEQPEVLVPDLTVQDDERLGARLKGHPAGTARQHDPGDRMPSVGRRGPQRKVVPMSAPEYTTKRWSPGPWGWKSITGDDLRARQGDVKYSNVTLAFGVPASSHFGTQAIHGVVVHCTGPWGRESRDCKLQE